MSVPGPTPATSHGKASRPLLQFLAFDYGRKRTGVASGNKVLGQATPLTTVAAEGDARFPLIARLIAQWQPDALVVGIPRHPDGRGHDNTRFAQRFARQLHGRFNLPVFEVDERYSTTEVLSSRPRDADAAAAAVLMQQYFDTCEREAAAASSDLSPDHPEESRP
jgi:putative Holliday junction resolvase